MPRDKREVIDGRAMPIQVPITTYEIKLVQSSSKPKFEKLLTELINNGWELSGELVITPLSNGPALRYTQPLIKATRKAQ